jgi:hypothetical protein
MRRACRSKNYPRADLLSAASRSNRRIETLLKFQLIKFNLMVPVDCEPT